MTPSSRDKVILLHLNKCIHLVSDLFSNCWYCFYDRMIGLLSLLISYSLISSAAIKLWFHKTLFFLDKTYIKLLCWWLQYLNVVECNGIMLLNGWNVNIIDEWKKCGYFDCAGIFTTRIEGFAECLKHSTKPEKHSTKSLPSVTLGKESSANSTWATTSLPRIFYRALSKDFVEWQTVLGKEKRLSRRRVTEMAPLPSVLGDTRQRNYLFAECLQPALGNRSTSGARRQVLCRVLLEALSKACFFAECHGHNTQQRSFTGAQVLLLCRVLWPWHSAKHVLPSVSCLTLGKEASLPSANARRSAKITAVSYRWLLTALCRGPPFAECLALGKDFFVECIYVPRVLLSVNAVVTESRTLPSARQKALGKVPSTRQRAGFR
jgi:hypothetical protein